MPIKPFIGLGKLAGRNLILFSLQYNTMEAKPLLVIQSSKPVSTNKAYKALKKFLVANSNTTESPTLGTLPDDALNKLTMLVTELEDSNANISEEYQATEVNESAKKKRKSEAHDSEDKKKKKEKKEKRRKTEMTAVDMNEFESPDVTDNKLMAMKSAIKKLKNK